MAALPIRIPASAAVPEAVIPELIVDMVVKEEEDQRYDPEV